MYDLYVIGCFFTVKGGYFLFIGNVFRILLRRSAHRQPVLLYLAIL